MSNRSADDDKRDLVGYNDTEMVGIPKEEEDEKGD